MNVIAKLPTESRLYVFDYSNWPEEQGTSPDLIASASVSADVSGLTIGACTIAQDGQHVLCPISGGTSGTTYTLTCTATTAGNRLLPINGLLQVVAVLPN
jgi:hypothetical protein